MCKSQGREKTMNWRSVGWFALGGFTCLLLIAVGLFFIGKYYTPSSPVANTTIQTFNSSLILQAPYQCNGLDLVNSSRCLQHEVAGIYNFTIRSDEERSLQDIEQNGGDCFDYNLLYKKWMNSLGFDADMIQFTLDNNASHIITLTWDSSAYCILDQQLEPDCVLLGDQQ